MSSLTGVGADEEGWKYRQMSTGDTDVDGGEGAARGKSAGAAEGNIKRAPSITRGWTSTCSPDCVWRQRKWMRRRRRRPCHPLLVCQPSTELHSLSDSKAETPSLEASKVLDTGYDEIEQAQRCEGMILIASLLCSCLRNVKLPQARRGAIQLLKEASLYIDDDARLQHVIPYVVALLSDTAAIVRCAALQTLCNVLSMVQVFLQLNVQPLRSPSFVENHVFL